MTSAPHLSRSNFALYVTTTGYIQITGCNLDTGILPVVYLKSSTKIIDGNGEKGTPFIAQ